MKKLFRALMVLMVVAMTVLTAGCADEEKYNALKRDMFEMKKEYVAEAGQINFPLMAKDTDPVVVRLSEKQLEIVKKYKSDYDKIIQEIGKAASGSTKLENDFKYLKKEQDAFWNDQVETATNTWEIAHGLKKRTKMKMGGGISTNTADLYSGNKK